MAGEHTAARAGRTHASGSGYGKGGSLARAGSGPSDPLLRTARIGCGSLWGLPNATGRRQASRADARATGTTRKNPVASAAAPVRAARIGHGGQAQPRGNQPAVVAARNPLRRPLPEGRARGSGPRPLSPAVDGYRGRLPPAGVPRGPSPGRTRRRRGTTHPMLIFVTFPPQTLARLEHGGEAALFRPPAEPPRRAPPNRLAPGLAPSRTRPPDARTGASKRPTPASSRHTSCPRRTSSAWSGSRR